MPAGQSCPPRYEALLQLREAISLHRDFPMRVHELTRRLHAATDFIQLAPHDVVIHLMGLHRYEPPCECAAPSRGVVPIDASAGTRSKALVTRARSSGYIASVQRTGGTDMKIERRRTR
jgi:hypothetical protein